MSIRMNATCLKCRVDRVSKTVANLGTEEENTRFLKQWFGMISQYPEDMDSSRCGYYTDRLMEKFYGVDMDMMKQEKLTSNQFVLERLELVRSRVDNAQDPIYAALQFAILGNYLDFAALGDTVSFTQLEEMLDSARDIQIDGKTYEKFCRDIANGKKLLYITDNAGEIGFDRVLAELLAKRYPGLEITFCVRGGPVANDATREDAKQMGITFPVIDSGSSVGGTAIELLSPQAKKALEEADVVIAKGLGNTESMFGCGYNVYYAFLVKCQRFAEFFNMPMMAPMFVNDRA